jgi:hypothetical protein
MVGKVASLLKIVVKCVSFQTSAIIDILINKHMIKNTAVL